MSTSDSKNYVSNRVLLVHMVHQKLAKIENQRSTSLNSLRLRKLFTFDYLWLPLLNFPYLSLPFLTFPSLTGSYFEFVHELTD